VSADTVGSLVPGFKITVENRTTHVSATNRVRIA
jgi:hypothetical protein